MQMFSFSLSLFPSFGSFERWICREARSSPPETGQACGGLLMNMLKSLDTLLEHTSWVRLHVIHFFSSPAFFLQLGRAQIGSQWTDGAPQFTEAPAKTPVPAAGPQQGTQIATISHHNANSGTCGHVPIREDRQWTLQRREECQEWPQSSPYKGQLEGEPTQGEHHSRELWGKSEKE